MKNKLFILFLFAALGINAQQDLLVAQFAINKQVFNPAYSSVENYYTVTGIIRDQWNGFEGAPSTQSLAIGLPVLKQNIALGFNLTNETIGIQKRLTFQSSYAYKLRLGANILHLGMNISYRNLINDFTDSRLFPIHGFENDPSIDQVKLSHHLINIGLGAYYEIDDYFIGFSIPRLLNNNISGGSTFEGFSKEVRHWYIMGGRSFDINSSLSLYSELLLKGTSSSPLDLDLQVRGSYNDFFIVGLNFRTGGGIGNLGESIAVLTAFQVSEALQFGISYDIPVSRFKSQQSGSLELFSRYVIGKDNQIKKIINPRYF